MIDTQETGHVLNSAANSLPAPKPCRKFRCGQLGQIVPKPLISWRVLTLGGCFLRLRGVFSLMAGKSDVLRRAGAGHAVGRVEPDPAEAAEELGQGQPVGQWQR